MPPFGGILYLGFLVHHRLNNPAVDPSSPKRLGDYFRSMSASHGWTKKWALASPNAHLL
jgi:hypothetical protein